MVSAYLRAIPWRAVYPVSDDKLAAVLDEASDISAAGYLNITIACKKYCDCRLDFNKKPNTLNDALI